MNNPNPLNTSRLILKPATVELVRAEMNHRETFAHLLGATIPENWPPETLVDALPLFLGWLEEAPDQVGWFGWYALAREEGVELPVLVGSGGFLGPPQDGKVQIGYSILEPYQRKGYATEMVKALVQWAFTAGEVSCLVAETEWSNPASTRVLEKVGFIAGESINETGGMRFSLHKHRSTIRPEPPQQ